MVRCVLRRCISGRNKKFYVAHSSLSARMSQTDRHHDANIRPSHKMQREAKRVERDGRKNGTAKIKPIPRLNIIARVLTRYKSFSA
jgi:hypothetical protein